MRTVHTGCVRRTDIQNSTDRLFQQGLAIIPGMSAAVVADALDESVSLVEAWASATRPNRFPAWALAHPRFPADLRAFMETGLRSMHEAKPCRASSPEIAHHITTGAIGEMLAVVARAFVGDGVIDPAEARGALPVALKAHRLLGTFVEELQRRAGLTTTGNA